MSQWFLGLVKAHGMVQCRPQYMLRPAAVETRLMMTMLRFVGWPVVWRFQASKPVSDLYAS
jgi:hypothetical protein